jgi:hypothetical protein
MLKETAMRRALATTALLFAAASVMGLRAGGIQEGPRDALPIFTATATQPNAISVPDMTTPAYSIAFPPEVGVTLAPGTLVDMSRSQFVTHDSKRLECKPGQVMPVTRATVAVATRSDKRNDDRQMALHVEAALSFFGRGKVSISNDEFEATRQNSVYALVTVIDGVQTIDNVAGPPKWPAGYKLPEGRDDEEKLKAFVGSFGTHYVYKLLYGRTICIKATLKEKEETKRSELETKLRSQLFLFSMSGEYAQKSKQELASYAFDLLISVQGGKADRPEQFLLRTFDELNQFIEKLKDGRFKIESAPVSAELLSLSGIPADDSINRGLRGTVTFVTESREVTSQVAGQYKDGKGGTCSVSHVRGFTYKFTNSANQSEEYDYEKSAGVFIPVAHKKYTAFYFAASSRLSFSDGSDYWVKAK